MSWHEGWNYYKEGDSRIEEVTLFSEKWEMLATVIGETPALGLFGLPEVGVGLIVDLLGSEAVVNPMIIKEK